MLWEISLWSNFKKCKKSSKLKYFINLTLQRKSYIEKAKTEVDECFKKHINMEQSFADDRKKSEEEFERRIEELRIEGMQVYSSLKKKMENDIQNLEKCYEEMKALYQLNTEKLDYNLKVLKEKR